MAVVEVIRECRAVDFEMERGKDANLLITTAVLADLASHDTSFRMMSGGLAPRDQWITSFENPVASGTVPTG